MTGWDENEDHPPDDYPPDDYPPDGHLREGKLLLYLDGELPPKEAAQVREHLTACWSCRMNADRVQEAIFAFVEYRDEALRVLAAPPPSDEQRFARRIEDLREQLGERSWLAHLYDSWRGMFSAARLAPLPQLPRPLVWAMAGLAVTFAAIALLTWADRAPVVTASELLRKASEAQARELGTTAQPVVYQKLQIKRGGRVATWELWRDTANARFRQSMKSATKSATEEASATEGSMRESGDAALEAELMEVLQANRMNPQQPLSAASFETWRQSLAAKREEVSRSQTEAGEMLTLRVSAVAKIGVGQIAEASLVVRGRDWRPQAQLLKVRGENEIREYELSETAYEVIPLAALTAFAEPAPKPSATRIPEAAPSPTVKSLPTSAELRNAEVSALYALHQLKADLGEQIEITRESNEQIVVRGQVETPERKRELMAALNGIAFVAARIQTFDEASAHAAPPHAPAIIAPSPKANSDSSPAAGINLFERRLARYFAERGGAASEDAAAINRRIARMANSAVSESAAALSSGWALRRLAERFDDGPGEQMDEQMSVAGAARLREVISNHLDEINTRSRNLRAQLEPALISIGGTEAGAFPSPLPTEGTRKARVLRLFKAIEQVQRLSYRLFDSGQTFAASPEEAARLMLQALAQLDAARLALEQDGHR